MLEAINRVDNIIISLNNDNFGLIMLVYNPVFESKT